MLNVFRLATRNVWRQRRRYQVLIIAIAFGFAVNLTISGLTGGMTQSVNASATRHYAGDLYILGHQKTPFYTPLIRDDAAIKNAINAAGLDSNLVVRRTNYFSDGMLYFGGSAVRMKRITGVEAKNEQPILSRFDYSQGSSLGLENKNGIIVSEAVAKELGAHLGDDIIVSGITVTGQKNTVDQVIQGIFRDSSIFGYYTCFMDIKALNYLMGLQPDDCTVYGIFLNDSSTTQSAADALYAALAKTNLQLFPPVATQPDLWQQLAGSWGGIKYAVLTLDGYLYQVKYILDIVSLAGWLLLVLLMGIVTIGIANTYRVIIHERTREIGTMRAIGMQRNSVGGLFVLEAAFIALLGLVIGTMISIFLFIIVSNISFAAIPGFEIFLNGGRMTASISPFTFLVNAGIVLFLTLAAVLMPARAASRIAPIEALNSRA